MRLFRTLCALVIAASVSGCAIIEAEKHNRGGFLDHMADDLWMRADSKRMRALRALAIEVSLARIAMIAPKSASDRSLLARRIGETTRRADVVRRCAFQQLQIPGQSPDEPCFFFDSVMVDYENALFDLAIIALPVEEAKNLMTRVTGGIGSATLNPLELVQTLIDIGRFAFRYGRVVGAIYRDTLELEVQAWLASPGLEQETAALRAVYAAGNDHIPAWRAQIAALRAQGLEPIPPERFATSLYSLLIYICGQIVSPDLDPAKDSSYQQCAYRPPGLQIPAMAPGTRTSVITVPLGTSTGGGGAREQELRLQLQREREQRAALQRQLDESRKPGPDGRTPPLDELARFRKTLCVEHEKGLGLDTQRAVKLFKAGLNEKLVTEVSDSLNANEKKLLEEASKKFPDCGRDNPTPPRNPFEVGLYASNTERGIDRVLRGALTKAKATERDIYSPGPNETLDLNRAVSALRNVSPKLPAPAGMKPTELDDGLWLKARDLSGI